MRLSLAWIELDHPPLDYYDSIEARLPHNVTTIRPSRGRSVARGLQATHYDAAIVGFGYFKDERPPLPKLPEFSRAACGAANASRRLAPAASLCWCGRLPLLVILNKEYSMLRAKLDWLRAHCVDAAFSVHHDVASYQRQTGVPFHRISFAVDAARFGGGGLLVGRHRRQDLNSTQLDSAQQAQPGGRRGQATQSTARRQDNGGDEAAARPGGGAGGRARAGSGPASEIDLMIDLNSTHQLNSTRQAQHGQAARAGHTYEIDLGFTGVIRRDQTANWRYRIWKSSWPRLAKRGVRLYSGERGGVHIGVAHAALDGAEYVRRMRSSKLWLSTTGPTPAPPTWWARATLRSSRRVPQCASATAWPTRARTRRSGSSRASTR